MSTTDAGTGTGTPGTGAPNTTEQQNAGTGTPTPNPQAPATDQAQTPKVDVAALQAENARLQKEAENARVKAKGAVADAAKRDQLLAVAAALGIDIPQGQEQTVESLQASLTEEANKRTGTETALNQERQARAIDNAAWKNNVSPEKAGYLGFLLQGNAEFQKMDPADANYQTSVGELVKTITAADPYFAATPGGAARSGTDSFGGAGQAGEVTLDDFRKMGVMEKTKLFQTNPELFNRLQASGS